MLRHIVAWNYKDGFTESENKENAQKVKEELEALKDIVNGIIELKVNINTLSSGNRDIILNSLFEDEKALDAYQIHPEHVRVGAFIGTVVQNRTCIDYYE